jgi:hypothetical protein
MHRRMSLGVGMLLLLVVLAGSASASAEPLAAPKARAVESFDVVGWVWDWLGSLLSSNPAADSTGGSGHLNGLEGGGFIDPNGSGNS